LEFYQSSIALHTSELRSDSYYSCYSFTPVSPRYIMSDSEQDASILGKRLRNSDNEAQNNGNDDPRPPEAMENDDSDDEVGPMPMAADGAVKKKRKGASRIILRYFRSSRNIGSCF